jgi:gas vesicle protein
MAKHESSFDFIVGFLFGALAGALAALLFAPTSGEDLREQIKEKGIELKERAEELGVDTEHLEELRARGQALLEEQRARFREAIEEGKLAAARRKEELLAQFGAAPHEPEQPIDLTDIEARAHRS